MLALNGGSSSIKFAVFDESLHKTVWGKIDKIGAAGSRLKVAGGQEMPVEAADLPAAADFLLQWIAENQSQELVDAIVHRVVHGMHFREPQRITENLMSHLKALIALDPDHLPGEIALIEASKKRFPDREQVACFDTAFHADLPKVAAQLPLPRRFGEQGIQKYGFHGISYSYLMEKLGEWEEAGLANKKIILAHLGSGSSMAAVSKGKSLDTSMGFTPVGGLVMGTRPGDMDPGLAGWLMARERLDAPGFTHFVNHECGLKGVSGFSAEAEELLAKETQDLRAAEALALFCYQAKKWIGAFSAVLNGLDLLVFTGGIGENSPVIRSRICEGLDYLGLRLDEINNSQSAQVISAAKSKVMVRVIPTDEEWMMAKLAKQLLTVL